MSINTAPDARNAPDRAKEQYAKMRKLLDQTGRSITYSISEYGLFDPQLWAPGIAHMWRTTDDLLANWDSILATLDKQRTLWPYSRPGAWNDPDMLQVGSGKLSENENRAHFLMWVILNAPLMTGHDITKMSAEIKSLLCNADLIAINQDWGGSQGRLRWQSGNLELWIKPMSSGGKAFVILNRGEDPESFALDLEHVGIKGDFVTEVLSGEEFELGKSSNWGVNSRDLCRPEMLDYSSAPESSPRLHRSSALTP